MTIHDSFIIARNDALANQSTFPAHRKHLISTICYKYVYKAVCVCVCLEYLQSHNPWWNPHTVCGSVCGSTRVKIIEMCPISSVRVSIPVGRIGSPVIFAPESYCKTADFVLFDYFIFCIVAGVNVSRENRRIRQSEWLWWGPWWGRGVWDWDYGKMWNSQMLYAVPQLLMGIKWRDTEYGRWLCWDENAAKAASYT